MTLKFSRNRFPLCLAVVTILLAHRSFCDTESPVAPRKPSCNKDLTAAFGFAGTPSPIPGKLSMCPMVINSCCTSFDQLVMYENWEFNHEHTQLKIRIKYLRDTYTTALNSAVHVDSLARSLLDLFASTSVTNCKVYAKRITHYQIAEVAPKLYAAIESMYTWWESIFAGFYCLICDADAHPYIHPKKAEVEYGVGFCRNLVMKNLPMLLYLNVHMPKYMNSIIQFTSSCNQNGTFTEDAFVDADLLTVDLVLKKKLEKCRDNRNAEDWFAHCSFICDEFNMVNIDKRFEPMAGQYFDANALVRAALERFEGRAKKPQADHSLVHRGRVLEGDSGVEGHGEKREDDLLPLNLTDDFWSVPAVDYNNITDTREVIKAGEGSDYTFWEFENVWVEGGLMPDKHSKYSEMSYGKYEKLYAEKLKMAKAADRVGAAVAVVLVVVLQVAGF